MKVHLQVGSDGFPININVSNALHGFLERGCEVGFFTKEQLINGNHKFNLDEPVVGSIYSVKRALRLLKTKVPDVIDYPDCLKEFLGREIWQSTIDQVFHDLEKTNYKEPLFIKPALDQKLFTGQVIRSFKDFIEIGSPANETVVYVSKPVYVSSEYRVFVNNKGVIGIKHYTGSSFICPDEQTVLDILNTYNKLGNPPVSYSLDIGITTINKTILIEVNDGYALGSYGLEPTVYAKFIAQRWFEMANQKLPLGWE